MIALLIAAGLNPGLGMLNKHYPSPLLPMVDRPFVQHVVEFLVNRGFHRFEFVLSHLPDQMEEFLGDGSRWGATFGFHLARDPALPYEPLRSLRLGDQEEYVLLGHADRLPLMDLEMAPGPSGDLANGPVFWVGPSDPGSEELPWTGWAWIPKGYLQTLPSGSNEEGLKRHLFAAAGGTETQSTITTRISVQSPGDLLASHNAVLDKAYSGLLLNSREVEKGLWISRNVILHPTAKLVPPVYIDEDCQIGSGARLGPYATIGKGCILNSGCLIEQAVVFPQTYVGDSLELQEVVVDKNRLLNVRYDTAVAISEHFLLGAVSASNVGFRVSRLASQAAAGVLLLLFWPFLLISPLLLKIVRRGPAIFTKEAVRLPTEQDNAFWETFRLVSFAPHDQGLIKKRSKPHSSRFRHFLLAFLPALLAIARGHLHFVGVRPRSREEMETMNTDWRDIYLKSKPGIITEAFVNYGESPTEDELYTSEVFYASATRLSHDFKLFWAYIRSVFSNKS